MDTLQLANRLRFLVVMVVIVHDGQRQINLARCLRQQLARVLVMGVAVLGVQIVEQHMRGVHEFLRFPQLVVGFLLDRVGDQARVQRRLEVGLVLPLVMMPVLENKSKYLSPALYDDQLQIVTTIKEKPSVRITFYYEIFNGSGKLIHEGETLLAFVNKHTGRPCRPRRVWR